jgi:hypothetical protein
VALRRAKRRRASRAVPLDVVLQFLRDNWPIVAFVIGAIMHQAWIDYMAVDTRSDVDSLIEHTEWGQKQDAGFQGPSPPVKAHSKPVVMGLFPE